MTNFPVSPTFNMLISACNWFALEDVKTTVWWRKSSSTSGYAAADVATTPVTATGRRFLWPLHQVPNLNVDLQQPSFTWAIISNVIDKCQGTQRLIFDSSKTMSSSIFNIALWVLSVQEEVSEWRLKVSEDCYNKKELRFVTLFLYAITGFPSPSPFSLWLFGFYHLLDWNLKSRDDEMDGQSSNRLRSCFLVCTFYHLSHPDCCCSNRQLYYRSFRRFHSVFLLSPYLLSLLQNKPHRF